MLILVVTGLRRRWKIVAVDDVNKSPRSRCTQEGNKITNVARGFLCPSANCSVYQFVIGFCAPFIPFFENICW